MRNDQRSVVLDVTAAALLCVTAGIADAVGFLHSGVFAANMTGNTVLVGISLAQHEWSQAVGRAAPIVAFFAGALIGRSLLRIGGERSAIVVEALVIGACAFVDSRSAVSIWLIAVAMGIQATAITKFAGAAVSTVVVTSTLARLAEAKHDYLVARLSNEPAQARAPVVLLAATWIAYGVGAVIAVLLLRTMSSAPLLLAAALVLVVLGMRGLKAQN